MIATGIAYNGTFKRRTVEGNVKSNSKYYEEKYDLRDTLHPIFTEEIPFLYTSDFLRVKLHRDKTMMDSVYLIIILEN